MARKKKAAVKRAPSKACVSCNNSYHPACRDCPHCGAANPRFAAVRKDIHGGFKAAESSSTGRVNPHQLLAAFNLYNLCKQDFALARQLLEAVHRNNVHFGLTIPQDPLQVKN